MNYELYIKSILQLELELVYLEKHYIYTLLFQLFT